jgi:hypothetical protein
LVTVIDASLLQAASGIHRQRNAGDSSGVLDLAVHPTHDILHPSTFGRSPKHVAQAMSSSIATNPSRPQGRFDQRLPFNMGVAER